MVEPRRIARWIDVEVECGKVYRYLTFQRIAANGRTANDICPGDTLPDLKIPDVEPPCKCRVVRMVALY